MARPVREGVVGKVPASNDRQLTSSLPHFLQPVGLAALLGRIKARGLHTTVYTGYTLEALGRRPEPVVRVALELTDLLIDGPFVASLAQGAGEWRGSRNQRLIAHPSTVLSSMPNAVATP